MANSSVAPLWTLDWAYDATVPFNGSVLFANSAQLANLSSNLDPILVLTMYAFNETNWHGGYPDYILYQDACEYQGQFNRCSAACSQNDTFFQSTETVYNCFIAPYVVAALQAPAPTYKNETIFSAAEMGLFRDSTYLNPIDTTKECFASYCNELGGCPSCNSSVLQELGGPNTYLAISACITNLCDTITGSLDSDLGGVGVFWSYVIQVFLSFIGPILKLVLRKTAACKGRQRPRDERKHRAALLSGYDEFHRGQCLFATSIQIASIVVIKSSRLNYVGMALKLNYVFLQTVAASQAICVTYTYWFLSRGTKKSRYRFILTLVTFILTCAAFGVITKSARDIQDSALGIHVEACGNVDLSSGCIDDVGKLTFLSAFLPWMWVIFVPCAILMLYMTVTFFLLGYKDSFWGTTEKCGVGLTRWLYVAMFFLVFILFILFNAYNTDPPAWTFGQIIAITVWSSAFLEVLQLEIKIVKDSIVHHFIPGQTPGSPHASNHGSPHSLHPHHSHSYVPAPLQSHHPEHDPDPPSAGLHSFGEHAWQQQQFDHAQASAEAAEIADLAATATSPTGGDGHGVNESEWIEMSPPLRGEKGGVTSRYYRRYE